MAGCRAHQLKRLQAHERTDLGHALDAVADNLAVPLAAGVRLAEPWDGCELRRRRVRSRELAFAA
jgi:hypothetical protein